MSRVSDYYNGYGEHLSPASFLISNLIALLCIFLNPGMGKTTHKKAQIQNNESVLFYV
jgi:hypothetical protein